MIKMEELIKGYQLHEIPIAHQRNLEVLHYRMNIVRAIIDRPMIVTNGYRSMQHHLRIYAEINEKRAARKLPPIKPPMGSRHLTGQACDISDPEGHLFEWTKDNEMILAAIGLWMEEKDGELRVHFQTEPPRSGKRWFIA